MSSNPHISKAAKNLIKNTIQSTNVHNKKKEEELMWRMHDKQESLKKTDSNYSDSEQNNDLKSRPKKKKKKWFHKLIQKEAKEPERWDHDGYKELYPEEFNLSKPIKKEKKKKRSSAKKKGRKRNGRQKKEQTKTK